MCKNQKVNTRVKEQPKLIKINKSNNFYKYSERLVQRDCNICGELTMCGTDLPWYGNLCKACKEMTD